MQNEAAEIYVPSLVKMLLILNTHIHACIKQYIYASTSLNYKVCRFVIWVGRHSMFIGVLWESWWDWKCSMCNWNSGGGVRVVYSLMSSDKTQNADLAEAGLWPEDQIMYGVEPACRHKFTCCFQDVACDWALAQRLWFRIPWVIFSKI